MSKPLIIESQSEQNTLATFSYTLKNIGQFISSIVYAILPILFILFCLGIFIFFMFLSRYIAYHTRDFIHNQLTYKPLEPIQPKIEVIQPIPEPKKSFTLAFIDFIKNNFLTVIDYLILSSIFMSIFCLIFDIFDIRTIIFKNIKSYVHSFSPTPITPTVTTTPTPVTNTPTSSPYVIINPRESTPVTSTPKTESIEPKTWNQFFNDNSLAFWILGNMVSWTIPYIQFGNLFKSIPIISKVAEYIPFIPKPSIFMKIKNAVSVVTDFIPFISGVKFIFVTIKDTIPIFSIIKNSVNFSAFVYSIYNYLPK